MNTRNITTHLIAILVGVAIGFVFAHQYTEPQQVVRYVKGKTIQRTVQVPVPYKIEVPSQPIYLYRKGDTVFTNIAPPIDTAAILNDWIVSRSYAHDLFDNQYGKLSIDASVQYNQLARLSYNFVPLQKETTIEKRPVWTPYLSVSYSSLNQVGVGGGVFYHHLGIGGRYVTDLKGKGLEVELKYKF